MRQHSENAQAVAEYLEDHPAVRFVAYPGLQSHPQHELARTQMKGFGGMLCFDLKGDSEEHINFLQKLKLIAHAVSLGDTESLMVFTESTSEKMAYYPEIFRQGYYRFSIGLEDTEDIIADLRQALS